MKLEMHKQALVLPDIVLTQKLERLLKQYIPGVKITQTTSGKENHYEIVIKEGSPSFNINNDRAIYTTPKISEEDIMALSSRITEYLWSKKGIYSVHSSAININDKTILMPGRPGAGKTTLMLALVKRFPEAKIISGDRTLIDNKIIVEGTKTLNFIASSLEEEFPYYSNLLKEYKKKNRVTFPAEKSPFTYHFEPTDISAIIYPQKHPGKFIGKEIQGVSNLIRFSNQAYYFLDEFPRLLIGALIPITTPLHDEEKQKTLYEMKRLTDTTPSYFTSGTLTDIVNFVESEIL